MARYSVLLIASFWGPLCAAQSFEFVFHAPQQELVYDCVTGVGSGTFELVIEEAAANPGFPNGTLAFAMGVGFPDELVTPIAAIPTGIIAALNDGDGPEFFGGNIAPFGGPGFTVICIYNLIGTIPIPIGGPEPVVALEFETVAGNLAGSTSDVPVPFTWCDCIGNPIMINSVILGSGDDETVIFQDGTLLLVPLVGPPFIRGDADGSGEFNGLLDSLFVLAWNFQNGPAPPCLAAADGDGDGVTNGLVDALYLLIHQFGGGPAPPAPYPGCGVDPASPSDCEITPCP